MQASVIICTHNPRPDYLRRVLDALKTQTLPKEQWELLLIDNASKEPLAKVWDLSWHPHARHIREDEVGLTPARLRGIKESTGELLVFVDDDNVLAQDYLEQAGRISFEFPKLGAWGGSIHPEFAIQPHEWMKPYWRYLAIRDVNLDQWSNLHSSTDILPCGAGMCVRHAAAKKYQDILTSSNVRKLLDRTGTSLNSQGDIDLALSACDLGLGIGLFHKLNLTHLIPEIRLTEKYFIRLLEGDGFSSALLSKIRGNYKKPTAWGRLRQIKRLATASGMERRLQWAVLKGQFRAEKLFKSSKICDCK
jgi:glycosyltransferase involved in cell wall biosynthesis